MQIQLDYPEPTPVTLEGEKTLLVIVDMANEVAHPAGEMYYEGAARIIPTIAELRRRVREAGGRIVHTQSVRSPDALEFTVFHHVKRHLGAWEIDFVDGLRPESDEPVVVKETHCSFHRTDMDALLERLGMHPGDSRVICTGTSARGCVQCAVVGFSLRDYYVYVPMDCVANRLEKDLLQAFSLFTGWSYSYNVTVTRSDLISLVPSPVRAARGGA